MTENRQYAISDYQLKQVEVRLKLSESRTWYSENPITDADAAVLFMSDILRDLDREWVCVLNLDSKLKPINFNVVSIGSVDTALVPIQNIMKSGILSGAAKIILIHTHPSGDPAPSAEDLSFTKKAVLAGELLEIPLVDHVITGCGTGQIFSVRSSFPEMFSEGYNEQEAAETVRNMKKRGRSRER